MASPAKGTKIWKKAESGPRSVVPRTTPERSVPCMSPGTDSLYVANPAYLLAAAVVELNNGATWPVSLLMIVIALTTVLAVLSARETTPKLAKLRTT